MTADQKVVAIVGLGWVGIRAFLELKKDKRIKLIAIDCKTYMENTTSIIECFGDKHACDHFLIDISEHAGLKPIFKRGLVTSMSDATLTLDSGETISFDFAILGVGSSYPNGIKTIPMIKDGPLHSKEERTAYFDTQRNTIASAESIIVVGASTVGVEVAAFIAEAFSGKSITLVVSGDRVLPGFDEKASQHAATWLTNHGVTIITNETVTDWGAIDAQNNNSNALEAATITTNKGTKLSGLVFRCVGAKPNGARISGLPLTASGAVRVNTHLQVDGMPNVFAAGDAASSDEEKTANYADYGGLVAAKNIQALIAGKQLQAFPEDLMKGAKKLPFVSGATLGKKNGVMQMGNDLTLGSGVATMKGFFDWMWIRTAKGKWFGTWMYRTVKSLFIGQLASVAKKTT